MSLCLCVLGSSVHAEESNADDDWLNDDPAAAAEETSNPAAGLSPLGSSVQTDEESKIVDTEETEAITTDKSLTLKLMVVNPSTKYKQVFPLKAYLPEEVKVEHILDKEDLEIAYDQEKKSFYVTKEIELSPGESVVKAVRVADVWFITEQKLNSISNEAHDVFEKLKDTEYSEQGRLLMNNIEVLLMQILERQSDATLTPNEHISVYRENKKRVSDIEMDLMAMRRFLAAAGEGFGKSKANSGAMPGFLSKIAGSSRNGMVPAGVLWRAIFMIMIFLGFITLVFVLVFQQQIRLSLSRNKLKQEMKSMEQKEADKAAPSKDKEKEELRISEFFPGFQDKPFKSDDHAA